jgi:hypothetical protein
VIGAKDIKTGDSVYIGAGDTWVSVLRVVADRTVQLSGGRWVRESELDYYGANCWRYHPESNPAQCPPGVHSMFDFCPGGCDKPISAREVLESYGVPEGIIDEALMAHAHELAEEIREETATLKRDGVLEPGKFRPCRDAADQIDPEED